MKATTFKTACINLLEDMSAGTGGALGDFDNNSGWMTGTDARLPKVLGDIITRPGLSPSKRKKKKKKKKVLKSSYRANTRVDTRVISPKLPVG